MDKRYTKTMSGPRSEETLGRCKVYFENVHVRVCPYPPFPTTPVHGLATKPAQHEVMLFTQCGLTIWHQQIAMQTRYTQSSKGTKDFLSVRILRIALLSMEYAARNVQMDRKSSVRSVASALTNGTTKLKGAYTTESFIVIQLLSLWNCFHYRNGKANYQSVGWLVICGIWVY